MRTVLPDGYTDLHSHLVPGVDDGSRTLEDSRGGVQRLVDAGVRRIVTTPHLDGSLTRDVARLAERLAGVDEAFHRLQNLVRSEFSGLELHRGHEVMLDIPDPDLGDARVRLGSTGYVLVEWPGLRVPPSTVPVLRRLAEQGVKPIIAHPERYRELDPEVYLPGEWKNAGALLQVNHGSVVGRYGELPRKRALLLLERGWVDLMASDFHGRPHLSPNLLEARRILLELGGGAQFGLLAGVNPTRILRGGEPIPVPPLELRSGMMEKLVQLFRLKRRR